LLKDSYLLRKKKADYSHLLTAELPQHDAAKKQAAVLVEYSY
jgi:hypothetical protein